MKVGLDPDSHFLAAVAVSLEGGRVKPGSRRERSGSAGGLGGDNGSRSVPKQPWPVGAAARPVDIESNDRNTRSDNVIASFC